MSTDTYTCGHGYQLDTCDDCDLERRAELEKLRADLAAERKAKEGWQNAAALCDTRRIKAEEALKSERAWKALAAESIKHWAGRTKDMEDGWKRAAKERDDVENRLIDAEERLDQWSCAKCGDPSVEAVAAERDSLAERVKVLEEALREIHRGKAAEDNGNPLGAHFSMAVRFMRIATRALSPSPKSNSAKKEISK